MKRILTIAALMLTATVANGAEWGGLKGQFVYDGKAPAVAPLTVTADAAYCGPLKPVNDTLVVGKNGGLANVVIFIYTKSTTKLPIAPSYEAQASQKVVLDNSKCAFTPHIVGVWNKQKLTVKNSDKVAHNTKGDTFSNAPFNPIVPAGASLDLSFTESERLPAKVSCSIHPWMTGYVLIKDHPYFAVTDAEGKFEIKDIPAGEWQFQVWHELSGYVKTVNVGGKDEEWSKGRVTKTIGSSTIDLGAIKVKPELFAN